jgi:sec-independent protein translocase protein TatA
MIGVLQPWHLIVVLVIAVMVVGPGKLPELGRALGDGLRELKQASGDRSASPALLAPVAVGASMACPACSTTVPSGAQFCGICGAAQATRRGA